MGDCKSMTVLCTGDQHISERAYAYVHTVIDQIRFKKPPKCTTVTLTNSIRLHISSTNLSQKQKCFYQMLIESKQEEEYRNQSKNGKAKEWVIIAYSFIILLNSSVLGVRLFDNGRKRVWFINGKQDEESTVCGVFPCFCECKL